MRDGELYPNPDTDYQFTIGNFVAVMGNSEQLAVFQTLIEPVNVSEA